MSQSGPEWSDRFSDGQTGLGDQFGLKDQFGLQKSVRFTDKRKWDFKCSAFERKQASVITKSKSWVNWTRSRSPLILLADLGRYKWYQSKDLLMPGLQRKLSIPILELGAMWGFVKGERYEDSLKQSYDLLIHGLMQRLISEEEWSKDKMSKYVRPRPWNG